MLRGTLSKRLSRNVGPMLDFKYSSDNHATISEITDNQSQQSLIHRHQSTRRMSSWLGREVSPINACNIDPTKSFHSPIYIKDTGRSFYNFSSSAKLSSSTNTIVAVWGSPQSFMNPKVWSELGQTARPVVTSIHHGLNSNRGNQRCKAREGVLPSWNLYYTQ